jgi:hypothetical protein
MVGMPLRAKRNFIDWFGLLLAVLTLLNVPSAVREMISTAKEDHRMWFLMPIVLGMGYGWNSYLLKRWWNPEAYKIKW